MSALQQLHSYFVSTLPRNCDGMVIAESFILDYRVLDRTPQLSVSEWLFVPHGTIRQQNVPVFIKTENNEEAVYEYAKKLSS